MKHHCEMRNEHKEKADITTESMWLYESDGEFMTDFCVNFCPVCGKQIRETELKKIWKN
jgi:hypothetical protein